MPTEHASRRRTKIVCTIGPAAASREGLEALVAAGMDVARLNFSHQTPEWHRERYEILRGLSDEAERPLAIIQDLPGPKVRVGEFPDGAVRLQPGDEFVLSMEEIDGDRHRASVNYPVLADELEVGDPLLLADGTIELKVTGVVSDAVTCEVITGGTLSSHKGINLPTRDLDLPAMTEDDRRHLEVGLELGVDFVALSFVRRPQDVEDAISIMESAGRRIPVIAKIERHEALDNLNGILERVDAILVARGDLALETPLEEVPQVQKRLIRAANDHAKPVITATQMLQSMVHNPRPSRAETSDVASAIYDGTDAVMLSEETAVGSYPQEAVRVMDRICRATEQAMEDGSAHPPLPSRRRRSVPDAVASAACLLARHLEANALVVPTRTGSTAVKVAACRPTQPIIAIGTLPDAVRRLCLAWGVVPIRGVEMVNHENMLAEAESRAIAAGLVSPGDLVVITAGFPVGGPGSTNTVTVKVVGEDFGSASTVDAVGGTD